MKKLLILVMVLAMASFAGAALKVIGAPTQPILPSDIVVLSIITDAPIPYQAGMYAAIVSGPGGVIDIASGITIIGDSGFTLEHSAPISAFVTGVPEGLDGMGVNAWDMDAGDTAAQTPLFGDIAFHCEGPGDVTVSLLLLNEDFSVNSVMDSVIIHQVPEPVTMALLGLGGLFLRRRMA